MFIRTLPLVLIFLLTACSNTDQSTPKESTDKPRVALVMKSLANEFFKTMEDSAQVYASENSDNFSLITNGIKNEEDVSGQITLVEQMIAQEVDAIVIAPAFLRASYFPPR